MRSFAHQERIVAEAVPNLQEYGYHAIFAEIGTGKSRTILEVARTLHGRGELDALIVCGPKSLAGTWREQVETHCTIEGKAFIAYDSTRAKTQKWMDQFNMFITYRFPILFVNTEAFQTMPSALTVVLNTMTTARLMLVIDESSDIKGPKAKRSLNLTKFGQRVAYRMIATGTEITNSILDLYQQFEFLKPGFWGFKSFYFFRNYYAILEERYISGGRTFKEVIGYRKVQEIQDRIAPFVSRARKADCLDLPERIYANMPVELTGPCAKAYKDLKDHLVTLLASGELVTVPNKVALFTKFRQITGGTLANIGVIDENPEKLQALIGELDDSGEQAIIWSCFTEEINLLERKLGKLWTVARFDGQTTEKDRQMAISGFQSKQTRIFLANPAAASQGLNLQSAHIEYWYSLPTQAKQYEQAEGRIHRSGQTEKCVYKSIIASGTVDERVAAILKDKTDVMAAFRDGTVADIIDLV